MSRSSTPNRSSWRNSKLYLDADPYVSPSKSSFNASSSSSLPSPLNKTSPRAKHASLVRPYSLHLNSTPASPFAGRRHSTNTTTTINTTTSMSIPTPTENTNIKVICRFRPLSQLENSNSIVEFVGNDTATIHGKETSTTITFDRVFGPESTQLEIYQFSVHQTIEDFFRGYNGTILAYGQTGSGKSYTMFGQSSGDDSESLRGLIPRITRKIFDHIDQGSADIEYTVGVSYMEIYLEQIKDLLDISDHHSPSNYTIHEDKENGVYVKGLSQAFVSSAAELEQVLHQGTKNRATSSTNMNFESSRSHAIFEIKLTQKNVITGTIKKSHLFLVDLAGSEKVIKTGAQGQNLEEAKKINSSLSTLGLVINSLTDSKSTHVPYRDSKLTRILQESLGGNSRTTLIINCSPASEHEQETLSTLRFGSRAKTIKNVVHVNTELSVHQLKVRIAQLEKLQVQNSDYINSLESEVSQWRNGETPDLTATPPPASENNDDGVEGNSSLDSVINTATTTTPLPALVNGTATSSSTMNTGHLRNLLTSPRTPSKIPLPPVGDNSNNSQSRYAQELARRDEKISELEATILSMKMDSIKSSHEDESKLFKLENALHLLNSKLNDVELVNVNLRKHLLISEKIIESRDVKIDRLKHVLRDQQHKVTKESTNFENRLDSVRNKLDQQKLDRRQSAGPTSTTFIEEGVETSFHRSDSLDRFLTDGQIVEQVLTLNTSSKANGTFNTMDNMADNGNKVNTSTPGASRRASVVTSPISGSSPRLGLNLRIVKPLRGGNGTTATNLAVNANPES